MLDISKIRELNDKETNEICLKILSLIRNSVPMDSQLHFVIVYLAYLSNLNGFNYYNELESFIEEKLPEQRAMFVKEMVKDYIGVSLQVSLSYSRDDLLTYLLVYPREYFGKSGLECGTPASVSKLASKVLDIKSDDTVADLGSGAGDFIIQATEEQSECSYYGIDINTYACEISRIRTELFAENAEIELGDMFAIPANKKFDKVFSNYPFGLRIIHLKAGTDYIEELHKKLPDIKKATSSDWIFNSLILDHLADDGKAVAIMTNGSTWNSIDQKIREFFVRNGLIETVIFLPARLFESVSIPTTMIVFSKGNKSVRLIDATKMCDQGRRQNVLTDDHINKIVELINKDGDEAITVDTKKLQENDFVLSPSRYLEKTIEFEDGVEFGSLMKRITRGAPLKASDLDEMISEEPTDTQYLMLANIQNGMISDDLPYLKELDPKLDKYCIKDRSLLLSKNGAPFKVAVAEIDEKHKLLGNGNLFIIELDEELVNPYFIKAFLDSEAGAAVLKSITVGATIPNISAEALKKIKVPLPSIEKQNEIADLYQAKQDEIKVLQLKIKRAQNDLKGIFGEVN